MADKETADDPYVRRWVRSDGARGAFEMPLRVSDQPANVSADGSACDPFHLRNCRYAAL
ncbi:hypothetical protein [Mycolicibacterium goodii]|uniref:hypothetical protein n=1 Tax=Mycolicibacterium goodii TaxID=134601 RepID=UPI000A764D28